jgi:hypothetical protein
LRSKATIHKYIETNKNNKHQQTTTPTTTTTTTTQTQQTHNKHNNATTHVANVGMLKNVKNRCTSRTLNGFAQRFLVSRTHFVLQNVTWLLKRQKTVA